MVNQVAGEICARLCFEIAKNVAQVLDHHINHNFSCDRKCDDRFDNKNLIKGNAYLRSLTLEQFTELVTTSRVPAISDKQFLAAYNDSDYSKNSWWISRKVVALPLIIYDSIVAIAASIILGGFPLFVIVVVYVIPAHILAISAIAVLIGVIRQGAALTRDDPEATHFIKILTVIKKIPVMIPRMISEFCAEINESLSSYPSLINFWHRLIARLIIISNDAKGLKNFHYIALKKLFQAKEFQTNDVGKPVERELILKTYCKIKKVNDEKRIELQMLLDNQMGKRRREKLNVTAEKEVSDNLIQFSKKQYEKELKKWKEECDNNKDPNLEEFLAVKYLLEPFFDLAKQFVHSKDQNIVLKSIADNVYKLAGSSELQGERRIATKRIFIRAKAQQILIDAVLKMQNGTYRALWNDRVELMLNGVAAERRWEQLINPLLDAFNDMFGDLQQDEELAEQAPGEIALVFFNSLKPNQKPALLNLLEKIPHLNRIIPNQEPQKIIGFNHKILVHLLPHQPQWLLKKSELKKIFTLFLLCIRNKIIVKLTPDVLRLLFSRIATMNYTGSNSRDLDQLAIKLRSAAKKLNTIVD